MKKTFTVFAILVTYLQVFAMDRVSENSINIELEGRTIDFRSKFKFAKDDFKKNMEEDFVATKPEVKRPNFVITGIVMDEEKNPLSNVSIIEKETNNGTITNDAGKFKINVKNNNSVLVISSVGYVTQEVKVGNKREVKVVLVSSIKSDDEVIVIGYGQVSKKDLTGAVGTVKMEDLKSAPVGSFTDALGGRLAGVQVLSNDGQPGVAQNVTIRGLGSLTQNTSPLYVVDGFPIENFDPATLNVEDIASINVLKDASATAIYGARGANGVVIIETNKGKIGKAAINFKGSFGIQKEPSHIELLSPYEYLKYNYELDSAVITERYFQNGKTLESYKNEKGIDWQDQVFNKGLWQQYSISLSGGTGQTKYIISGSVYDQKGVVLNTRAKRYQGRMGIDQNINKKLSVGLKANYSQNQQSGLMVSEGNGGGANNSRYVFFNVWGYRPISGKDSFDLLTQDVDEFFTNDNNRMNPVTSLTNAYRVNTDNNLLTNAYFNYKITNDLTLKITGGLNNRSVELDQFFNSKTQQGTPKNPNNTLGINGSIRNTMVSTWSNENILTYKKKLNTLHDLTLLAGASAQKSTRKISGVSVSNIPNEELGIAGFREGTPYASPSGKSDFTLASFFGRLNYEFASRYLLTATFRADGSSKFSSQNKWGYFPSGALAWNMKEEKFLKYSKLITSSKIRSSYGITGNNRVGEFDYLSTLTLPLNSSYSFNNGIPTPGAIITSVANPDLTWEATEQLGLGYDVSFLNKIDITVDLYRRTTSNLLLNADLPGSIGFNNGIMNIGKLKNEGLEITINSVNIKRNDFSWTSNFNISFNRNKILKLSRNQNEMYSTILFQSTFRDLPLYVARLGQPAGMFYGLVFDGVYQYSDFDNPSAGVYTLKEGITANGSIRTKIQPGDIKYKDLNGDMDITDADRKIIGQGFPIHTGGFSNRVTYKGFDINAFLQWSYGNKIFNANRIEFEENQLNRKDVNQYATVLQRWTPNNPSNTYFRAGGNGTLRAYSTRNLEDGSFLRLKTLSIGYSIPAAIVKKLNIQGARIGFAGQNLITWTKYSGMDPEVSTRDSNLTPGYDYCAYPQVKTFVFDISINF